VALEINCQVERLDLSDVNARMARDRGVMLTIGSDAHAVKEFERLKWGATVARRAGLGAADILTTRPVDQFKASLRRARSRV
jgi:DNA polymerase (family 10)